MIRTCSFMRQRHVLINFLNLSRKPLKICDCLTDFIAHFPIIIIGYLFVWRAWKLLKTLLKNVHPRMVNSCKTWEIDYCLAKLFSFSCVARNQRLVGAIEFHKDVEREISYQNISKSPFCKKCRINTYNTPATSYFAT